VFHPPKEPLGWPPCQLQAKRRIYQTVVEIQFWSLNLSNCHGDSRALLVMWLLFIGQQNLAIGLCLYFFRLLKQNNLILQSVDYGPSIKDVRAKKRPVLFFCISESVSVSDTLPSPPRPRTSGSQIFWRFRRLRSTQSSLSRRPWMGRGVLPNGQCCKRGGRQKSPFARTSLMDDPLTFAALTALTLGELINK